MSDGGHLKDDLYILTLPKNSGLGARLSHPIRLSERVTQVCLLALAERLCIEAYGLV